MLRQGLSSFEGEIDLEDLQKIYPLPIEGWQPDVAEAEEKWRFPHDLRLRRILNREMRTKRFRFDPHREPLRQVTEHLARRATEERAAATDAARMQANPASAPAKRASPPKKSAKPTQSPHVSKLGALFPVDLSRKKAL